MKRLLTPGRLIAAGLVLLATVLALMIFPSDQYIFLPDAAHPVAPLVTFKGSRNPTKGGVFFVEIVAGEPRKRLRQHQAVFTMRIERAHDCPDRAHRR